MKSKRTVLCIESSFDDTGIAILDFDFQTSVSLLSSSAELHSPYGGVVPEIAARDHIRNLPIMLKQLLSRENKALETVSCLGVTRGPGLPGCLLAGVSFARGVAQALSVPLYGLNHLYGHLFSPFFGLREKEIPFPFLGLVVTGGNTALYLVNGLQSIELLGETLDDSAGELFDKIAFKLNLGYPGGARLEEEAKKVQGRQVPREFILPIPMRESEDLNFSFSGLKTAALRLISRLGISCSSNALPWLASSLQQSVWESLWLKLIKAVNLTGAKHVAVSGGVAANQLLRDFLTHKSETEAITFHFPKARLCTDNAEMMAYLLLLYVGRGMEPEPFDIDANLV